MPIQINTQSLSKHLDAKLSCHFFACSAFVGTAALLGTSQSEAAVVYSGPLNINVPDTNIFGGIYLDLTRPGDSFSPTTSGSGPADGLNTLLPGWDVNFYKGSPIRANCNRKNVAAPVFFFSGSTEAPELSLAGISLTRTCVFCGFDSEPPPRRHCARR